MIHTPVGTHCILELTGCPAEILNDMPLIRDALAEASKHGMSTLLDLTSHKFEPQGVTALALLAESHISIHTWPESGYAALDVFTCGEHARPRQACEYLIRRLKAASYSLRQLPRGAAAALHEASALDAELAADPTVVEESLCPVPN